MWKSVLLETDLALGLLKSAIRSGHVALARPETGVEKSQIDDVARQIDRSRTEQQALTYCLLGDRVYMDGVCWSIFRNLDIDDNPEAIASRPLLESLAPELREFVNTTDSGSNNFLTSYQKPDQELANMFSAAEPLIWKSFRKAGIERKTLRFALDLFVLAPELMSVWNNSSSRFGASSRFREAVLAVAEEQIGRNLSGDEGTHLAAVAGIAITKGFVAVNKVIEAQERNAIYPVVGLTTGRDRIHDIPAYFKAHRSSDLIAATKVFLDEIEYWPVIRDIDDLLRIRSVDGFLQFRNTLRRWVDAAVCGDNSRQLAIRHDIKKANAALRRSATCAKIGRWFTYLGLPIAALDALTLPIFGASLTVAGFGLQALGDALHRKGRWIIVGK